MNTVACQKYPQAQQQLGNMQALCKNIAGGNIAGGIYSTNVFRK